MAKNPLANIIESFGRVFSKEDRKRTRALDAASGGRRWDKAQTIDNLNSTILSSSTIAARRAGYYARNNPWVASAVASLVGNAVGTGIVPRSQHPDPAVRDKLHRLWAAWCAKTGFYGKQALAVRQMVEAGEAFARYRVKLHTDGYDVPLDLELIDREQVPLDRFVERGTNRVRAGIEFDADGNRVAFHVLPHRPGDPFAPLTGNGVDTVRLPAEDVLHLFQPLTAGQLRGITWLASTLLRLHELDQYEDAALVKAKVAALFAGFITDPDGSIAGQNDGSAVNGILNLAFEPGTLAPLPPGTDIRFSDPKGDTAYAEFVRGHLRAIAAGIGVTYEQLTGDYSATNYSSARAALVEHRRRLEQLQHNVIIPQFCAPVWARFVRVAVLSGALHAPDFERNAADYLAVEFLPPKFDFVDPAKDVKAELEAIAGGLKSRAQAVAERGYDIEQIDAEIAADQAREQNLGLSFGKAAAPAAAPQEQETTDEQ